MKRPLDLHRWTLLSAALLGALLSAAACAGPGASGDLPGRGPVITLVDGAGGPVAEAELWVVDRRTLRADAAVLASRVTGDWVATSMRLAAEVRRSDDRGRARLAEGPPPGVFLAARKGALFGSVELPSIGRDGLQLTLRPRTSYRARVLHADGRPAAGVPLTLAVPGEPRAVRLPVTATTDERGVAVLHEPPPEALAGLRRVPGGTRRVALARVATREPLVIEVDPVGLGEGTLPPCGDLRLRLGHGDFPADHWGGVLQVFPARNGSRSDATLAVPVAGSEALVRHVERGVDLRSVVVVAESGGAGARLLGSFSRPLEALADEGSVERTLRLDGGVLVEGRMVDGEGRPRGGAAYSAMVADEPSTTWSLPSDAEGRFRWLLVGPAGPEAWTAIRIGGRRDGVTVELPTFEPGGAVSVGDVVLP